jgi:hypothetical protein
MGGGLNDQGSVLATVCGLVVSLIHPFLHSIVRWQNGCGL